MYLYWEGRTALSPPCHCVKTHPTLLPLEKKSLSAGFTSSNHDLWVGWLSFQVMVSLLDGTQERIKLTSIRSGQFTIHSSKRRHSF